MTQGLKKKEEEKKKCYHAEYRTPAVRPSRLAKVVLVTAQLAI